MSENLISLKVFVPSTRFCLGPLEPFPMTWQSHPSSLVEEVFQIRANLWCLRSCLYCKDCLDVFSRTGISRLWRNLRGYLRWSAWAGVMTLAVFAVCERVCLATSDVSTIGGLWDLVRHAMSSSGLRGIGLSGGFGMTTLGSGAGGLECSPLD